MRSPDIAYLTNVYFDFEAVSLLPELQHDLLIAKPLIVTDKGIVRSGLISHLPSLPGAALFDEVETNPTEEKVLLCLDRYRQEHCDGLVALGGGSSIDLAKGVALLAHHAPPLAQYSVQNGGWSKIQPGMPAVLAIPTTAGSGSEVGRAALLTLSNGTKCGFLSPHLIPKAAICDPLLTLSLPRSLTAATGMDALSHCIEVFCSNKNNPVAEAIALDGLDRAWRNIETVCNEPSNREGRREMMLAALEGGLGFQKGLGAVHSLSHPLGGLPGKSLHHGTLNAIFLPHVLRFNYDFCRGKMDRMAGVIGVRTGAELPDAMSSLTARLLLPQNLSALGVVKEDLAPLAENAFRDHSTPSNPRPLDKDSLRELYLRAL